MKGRLRILCLATYVLVSAGILLTPKAAEARVNRDDCSECFATDGDCILAAINANCAENAHWACKIEPGFCCGPTEYMGYCEHNS